MKTTITYTDSRSVAPRYLFPAFYFVVETKENPSVLANVELKEKDYRDALVSQGQHLMNSEQVHAVKKIWETAKGQLTKHMNQIRELHIEKIEKQKETIRKILGVKLNERWFKLV